MKQVLQLLLAGLRDWRWSHTGWALFVGAATLFANGTPLSNPTVDFRVSIALTYNVLQFGFPLVLLLGFAHRLVDARLMPPGLAYPLVVLIEVVCGVWLIGPALVPWLGAEPWWTAWNDVVLASTTLFWHGLGVAVVAQHRLNQRAEAQRVEAELQHAERQRALAATELLALQARVDPPLLFERLQRIDAELISDPPQARRRLGALIDLLRALQPHAQARESLLGRELDALLAYARLSSREAQGSERLHVRVPETMLALPFSPVVMMLIVLALIFLLGWPFEWPAIILVFLPIFYPVMEALKPALSQSLGIPLDMVMVWFGAVVAVVLQTAFLSPPVAMSAYYLRQVVKEWSLGTIYKGMFEFMILQVLAIALIIVFPKIVTTFPEQLREESAAIKTEEVDDSMNRLEEDPAATMKEQADEDEKDEPKAEK